jgi:hypothetical protein
MNLEIYYDNKLLEKDKVFNDRTLFKNEPEMTFVNNLQVNQPIPLYTIIMLDLLQDEVFLHELICNIHFNKNLQLKKENIFVKYSSPNPPANSGQHKYTFYLYKQNNNTPIKNPHFKNMRYNATFMQKWIKSNKLIEVNNIYILLNS